MLRFLNITNFAVIDRVELEFEEGLNVLTGETGSGKSIIVDALDLLFGARGSGDLVRSGEAKLMIEASFDIKEARSALLPLLDQSGIEIDNDLIIKREISSTGKTRSFIAGQMASAGVLRKVRPFLVDIYGQGEQQTLLDRGNHLHLLDSFGKLTELAREVSELFQNWATARRNLQDLSLNESDRLRQRDVWQFEAEEISRIAPTSGEDERLKNERSVLVNAEKIMEIASFSYGALYEQESSVSSVLATVKRRLDDLSLLDNSINGLGSQVENCLFSLEDVALTLRDYLSGVDASPQRLAEVESRLVELDRLKRKYGGSLDQVLGHLNTALANLQSYQGGEAAREQSALEVQERSSAYLRVANKLDAAHREAARSLEGRLVEELKHLAMERVEFAVAFTPSSSAGEPQSVGLSDVEFLFSPNPGEELRPISRIASGGELSRLMLALKSILAPVELPRTLVFDEVDAGVSGRAAQRVGERLRDLSETNQVLCVTHQAQIARFADIHYQVEKRLAQSRTTVSAHRLDGREREREIAQLLGGAKITETTRLHAAELLKTAPRRKSKSS